MSELKRCPCGKTPAEISIVENGEWVYAYPDCCGEWYIEFRSDWERDPDKLQALANEAWNSQPRGIITKTMYLALIFGGMMMWFSTEILLNGKNEAVLAMFGGLAVAYAFEKLSRRKLK